MYSAIMRRWLSWFWRLAVDQRAATAVEYGLIIALIVLALVGALQSTANSTNAMWNRVNSNVANATR